MTTPYRRTARHVGIAVVAIGLCLLLRHLLDPWLGDRQPYAPGFAVTAAVVFLVGWPAAVLTAVGCFVGYSLLFVAPRGELTLGLDLATAVLNALALAIIIWLGQTARSAREDLTRANAELARRDREKDRFMAIVAHELRGPMAAIRYAIELLHHQSDLPTQAGRTVRMMKRHLEQGIRVLEDLTVLGQQSQGRLTIQRAPADVWACVDEAVEANRAAIAAKRQHLLLEAPPAPLDAHVDRGRITQVMANLLNNACKYCPDGATIRIRGSADADAVTLVIEDSGPGLPFTQPAPLEPAPAAGGAAAPGGLGIGLWLSRSLVQMHGGSFEVSPGACAGTRVSVRLPRGAPAADPARAPGIALAATAAPARQPSPQEMHMNERPEQPLPVTGPADRPAEGPLEQAGTHALGAAAGAVGGAVAGAVIGIAAGPVGSLAGAIGGAIAGGALASGATAPPAASGPTATPAQQARDDDDPPLPLPPA